MNKDEALQQALEALIDFDYDKRMKAIGVIKEALDEGAQHNHAIEAKLKEKNHGNS